MKRKKEFVVYKMTCTISDAFYIGQTYCPLKERLDRHIAFAKSGKDTKLYRYMRKYGIHNFTIDQLEACHDQASLDEREFYYISMYRNNPNILNTKFTKGKCGGDTFAAMPPSKKKIISGKISQKCSGANNHNAKAVICRNTLTSEIIEFGSAEEARKYFGMKEHSPVTRRCNNKIKALYNNIWKFRFK